MTTLLSKVKEKFPVLKERSIVADAISGVLLLVFIALVGLIWNGLLYFLNISQEDITQLNFFNLVSKTLKTNGWIKFEVWHIIVLFVIIIVGYRAIKRFLRQRENINNPIWKEQVGDYTVGELFLILKSRKLPFTTNGMVMMGVEPPDENVLVLFETFLTYFNAGITNETMISDHGYLFSIVAPELYGYGLLTQTVSTDNSRGLEFTTTTYQISDMGRKFVSCLRRLEITMKSDKN